MGRSGAGPALGGLGKLGPRAAEGQSRGGRKGDGDAPGARVQGPKAGPSASKSPWGQRGDSSGRPCSSFPGACGPSWARGGGAQGGLGTRAHASVPTSGLGQRKRAALSWRWLVCAAGSAFKNVASRGTPSGNLGCGGSIYTMETGKCYRLGVCFSWRAGCYTFTRAHRITGQVPRPSLCRPMAGTGVSPPQRPPHARPVLCQRLVGGWKCGLFLAQGGLLSACGWHPLSGHRRRAAELCAGAAGALARLGRQLRMLGCCDCPQSPGKGEPGKRSGHQEAGFEPSSSCNSGPPAVSHPTSRGDSFPNGVEPTSSEVLRALPPTEPKPPKFMGPGPVRGPEPDLVGGALLDPPPLSHPEPPRIPATQQPTGAADQGRPSARAEPQPQGLGPPPCCGRLPSTAPAASPARTWAWLGRGPATPGPGCSPTHRPGRRPPCRRCDACWGAGGDGPSAPPLGPWS